MSPLTILDDIRIASPCPAEWSEMKGDDRARFCSLCSKHVYNISALTAEEATALIRDREGRICARIYRRADGTVLTADCPVGVRSAPRRGLHKLLALGLVVPTMLLVAVNAMGLSAREIEPFPTGPTVTWDDRIDWALISLGLRKPPTPPTGTFTMGDVAF